MNKTRTKHQTNSSHKNREELSDQDDAPEITDDDLERAEVVKGGKLIFPRDRNPK